MNIVLLGPPGAGKGTQAKMLTDALSIPHIATGDIFRKAVSEGTPMGVLAKEYMDKGELVPDSVVIGIVGDRLVEADCENGFMLDGFPRTIGQAEALKDKLEEIGKILTAVISIEVSEPQVLARLGGRITCVQCGGTFSSADGYSVGGECPKCQGELIQRPDDTDETIKNRLRVYEENTEPLIGFYQDLGLILEVDGSQSVDDVFVYITESLKRLV